MSMTAMIPESLLRADGSPTYMDYFRAAEIMHHECIAEMLGAPPEERDEWLRKAEEWAVEAMDMRTLAELEEAYGREEN